MIKLNINCAALALGALCLSLTYSAQAQVKPDQAQSKLMNVPASANTTAYVTANKGNDLNPCTRTAPCRQVNQALSVVAVGGKVIILDSGDYAPFTITFSVTVEAALGVTADIVTPTNQTAVLINSGSIGNDTVVLRGLNLRGGGSAAYGIDVTTNMTTVRIENCQISGFAGVGISFGNNAIIGGNFYVTDTQAVNNYIGLFAQGQSTSGPGAQMLRVERSRFDGNGFDGFHVTNCVTATARDTTANSNFASGFNLDNNSLPPSPAQLTLDHCIAAGNGSNGFNVIGSMLTGRASDSSFLYNKGYGLRSDQRSTLISYGNNHVSENKLGEVFGTISSESLR